MRALTRTLTFTTLLCPVVSLAAAPPATKTEEPAPPRTKTEEPAPPFAFADFSWVPDNYGSSDRPLSFGPFIDELRVDGVFHHSCAQPVDNTISGSSEVFRHGEFQITQLGVGGDFFYKNVMARLMTQFGMYSQTTPRNGFQFFRHLAGRFIKTA